jgi:thaumarchaeosortase
VILVLMVKLDAPRRRKALYAAFGAIGTYFVNVIRIMFIVLYVTYISLDFEAFHQSIGEVLFIAWIFIYLLLVIRMENARYKSQKILEASTNPTSASPRSGQGK